MAFSLKDVFEGRAHLRLSTESVTYRSQETSVLLCQATSSKPTVARISTHAKERPGLLECKKFYGKQSRNALGEEGNRRKVRVYISDTVNREWIPFLISGMDQINEACPGVRLVRVMDKSNSDSLIVIEGISEETCFTQGNILELSQSANSHKPVSIYLYHDWENMKRTSVHELLHALGAQHEHQAAGAGSFLYNECPPGDEDYDQYAPSSDFLKVTRRDPFSIMMYPEGCGSCLTRKANSDMVWNLKAPTEDMNDEMSELDKVGLNLVYRPCRSVVYNPVCSPVTGLWYCGRRVMKNHNRPAVSTTEGHCGPTNWANCPACRTLKNDVVDNLVSKGRWQGWSGLVYCGRYFGMKEPQHDGYCGPNNGLPCPECSSILLPTTFEVSFHSERR